MRHVNAKPVAEYGILLALALIFSYVEAQIPVFFAVPGMKLGLTNIVVLYALYCMGGRTALCISTARVFLVCFLFGNGVGLWYSLAGALFSFLVMYLLQKYSRFGMISVSMAGGIAHNLGQVLVAGFLFHANLLLWYFPILWLTGTLCGALIGILGGLICGRVQWAIKKINYR